MRHPVQTSGIHQRWATGQDLPTLVRIDAASFAQPWTEEDFRRLLRQRPVICQVAEVPESPSATFQAQYIVIGFAIYELKAHSFRLHRLAVEPAHRRQRVGTQLVAKLVNKLAADRREAIDMDVRESNLPAQLFLRALGFQATDILRRHFADTDEDAYQMTFLLPPDARTEDQE